MVVRSMTRLDSFLAYAEAQRASVCAAAAVLIAIIAWGDWELPDTSIGFLYLIPILLSAAALNKRQILAVAALCGYFREAFDPLQMAISRLGHQLRVEFDPRLWVPGSLGRMAVSVVGFAMTGFFVAEVNQRRRMLSHHLAELERQVDLRVEAERQLRILIETSPLAILTLDSAGRVVLANESATNLLGFEDRPLQGTAVEAYLPILRRMLQSHHAGGANIRTNVECKGQRSDGEVFLAHVWLSTYRTSEGAGLAAVIWDASENLRDREGAGLDSMMATSRVLIGAISHEIRNLASAAASAHAALLGAAPLGDNEQYQVLGTLIRGLEKIAQSGLRVASDRERVVADLGTVLDETRIVIESSLRESGVEVSWDVREGLPLVQADHHSLLQVFVNLARNSRQAMEASREKRLHISAEVESDLVLVRFRDTGCGVAQPDELFRPFQPGAHSFGIGLYISRAILRSHGGGLRYEPVEQGSCFAVELWPAEDSAEG
jgi:two-component system, LuxR family, sensor kinase FixL